MPVDVVDYHGSSFNQTRTADAATQSNPIYQMRSNELRARSRRKAK